MGVTSLWEILSPAEEKEVMVSTLRGCTLAVDLGIWIVEMRQAVQENENLFHRNLLYRILGLLSEGIKLVIVVDGQAPMLKQTAMKGRQKSAVVNLNRPWMASIVQECMGMLKSLGLPVVYSKGEAEATCAYLNASELVDGCLSNDSDFFCYGGKVLYRKLRRMSKGYAVDKVSDVGTNPGLSQPDLIALALLIGCDYNKKGVPSVGKEKAYELVKHLKANGHNVLERVIGWRTSPKLIGMEHILSKAIKQPTHCKKCNHLGKTSDHKKSGCCTCKTKSDCAESSDATCPCCWHKQKQLRQDNQLELAIIAEFLNPDTSYTVDDMGTRPMDVAQLLQILPNVIKKTGSELQDKLVPCYILQQLYNPTVYIPRMFEPVRINKQCKVKDVACYEVSWDKTDQNSWADEHHSTSVPVKVEKSLMREQYPALVSTFVKEKAAKNPKAKKRKRDADKGASGSIERFFSIKRRLDYSDEPEQTATKENPASETTEEESSTVDDQNMDGASDEDLPTGTNISGDGEDSNAEESEDMVNGSEIKGSAMNDNIKVNSYECTIESDEKSDDEKSDDEKSDNEKSDDEKSDDEKSDDEVSDDGGVSTEMKSTDLEEISDQEP